MPFKTIPPLYRVWQSMRDRCYNPNFKQWKDYGGRGIKICARWDTYTNFEADMSPRPPGTALDRIDNDGDYTPQNCRWATRSEQQLNQRRTRKVTIEGVEYKVWELSKKYGVKAETIIDRATEGLAFEACVRPKHLRWNTGRPAETCKNGHKYTSENTRILKNGMRACRECLRANFRRRYWATKQS